MASFMAVPVTSDLTTCNVKRAFDGPSQYSAASTCTRITAIEGSSGPAGHQAMLLANAVAQAEALMVGRPVGPDEPDPVARQKNYSGDRPSSFILIDRLTPQALGALIALFEHKVFVEGVIWEINSFDQWGVELGKNLASDVLEELKGGPKGPHDPSTTALIARLAAGAGGQAGL